VSRPVFTGSSAERALECPASAALPRVDDLEGSDEAARGTVLHQYLATVGQLGVDGALANIEARWHEACQRIDLTRIPQIDPASYAAEVAFAYHVEAGESRELGRGLTREQAVALYAAELRPGEVPLTVDVVGLAADRVFCGDFKTGRRRVARASVNPQLLLGALAATRAWGVSSASLAVIYIREDDEHFVDQAEVDEFDLAAFAERLRVGAAAVMHARQLVAEGQDVDVYEGKHCTYCPAFKRCPAKVALVHAVTSAPATYREDARDMLTPARAAEAVRRVKLARQTLHLVQVELEAYAAEVGGIDMGDGVTFGPRRSVREGVDGLTTHRVLEQLHGRDIADRAVTLESTKAGIKDALRKVAQDTGSKITHLERDALAAIAKAGGVHDKVTTKVDEHRRALRQPAKEGW
jgi:hypothetical protein